MNKWVTRDIIEGRKQSLLRSCKVLDTLHTLIHSISIITLGGRGHLYFTDAGSEARQPFLQGHTAKGKQGHTWIQVCPTTSLPLRHRNPIDWYRHPVPSCALTSLNRTLPAWLLGLDTSPFLISLQLSGLSFSLFILLYLAMQCF